MYLLFGLVVLSVGKEKNSNEEKREEKDFSFHAQLVSLYDTRVLIKRLI